MDIESTHRRTTCVASLDECHDEWVGGVSKVMMDGGFPYGVLGLVRVVHTWGSAVKRWILSLYIGVRLAWRHSTCVMTNGSEGVSKVMMDGGFPYGVLGLGIVVYTWGSGIKRWILSLHIGVHHHNLAPPTHSSRRKSSDATKVQHRCVHSISIASLHFPKCIQLPPHPKTQPYHPRSS